jgi:hypothetical protein
MEHVKRMLREIVRGENDKESPGAREQKGANERAAVAVTRNFSGLPCELAFSCRSKMSAVSGSVHARAFASSVRLARAGRAR